jgi:hypothetical protein
MPIKIPNSVVILSDAAQPCPVCGSLTFNPLCSECVEVVQQSLLLNTFHYARAGRVC